MSDLTDDSRNEALGITVSTRLVETRTVWTAERAAPEGYRFLHHDIGGDGYWSLWTAAPKGYPVPMDGRHDYLWISSHPHIERRYVTEWERV